MSAGGNRQRSSRAPLRFAATQKQRYAFPHACSDVRAGGQRHAAKDRRALRRGCDHPDQDAGGFLDIVEVDKPAPDLMAQPIRQRRGGAGNAAPVKRRRQIGELASLLQDDALKRDDVAPNAALRERGDRVMLRLARRAPSAMRLASRAARRRAEREIAA